MNKIIKVIPYNPEWPEIFKRESALVQIALGDNCVCVHHVGSTSIPEMSAKPIIDMIPVVKDISKVDDATACMLKLGYEANGESGIFFRRFFTKSTDEISCNVHVYEENAGEISRLLMFRDWMRTHPDDAKEYSDLKSQLALQFKHERLRYSMGKEDFIFSIDNKTGFSGFRTVKALTNREWETYHRIRKEQIFDLIQIEYDANHPDFKDESQFHLVLYKGSVIAGAAQLEFLNANEVALRLFAIDAPYQNQGIGTNFLNKIEKWLRHQGRNIIHLHAKPLAVKFYERSGYSRMPFQDNNHAFDVEYVDMGKVIAQKATL